MTEGKAREGRVNNLLFVCRANICRSPMAGAIFDVLAEENGLDWQAASAGVAALEGEDITPNARAALEEVGIYAGSHRARQVSEAMLEEADLVLAMTPRHVAKLRRLSTASLAKAHVARVCARHTRLGGCIGLSMASYIASMRQTESVDHLLFSPASGRGEKRITYNLDFVHLGCTASVSIRCSTNAAALLPSK